MSATLQAGRREWLHIVYSLSPPSLEGSISHLSDISSAHESKVEMVSGYTESKISGLKHDDANVFSTISILRSNLESSKRMPLLGTVTVFF